MLTAKIRAIPNLVSVSGLLLVMSVRWNRIQFVSLRDGWAVIMKFVAHQKVGI